MEIERVSVLVVGAGVAGLTTALALARSGVDVLVVTKYQGTANSPRAHITNQRTMEVFRSLGIEERIKAVATPNNLMGNNVWATSFSAPELARLETWGTGANRLSDYAVNSPSAMCNVPQHILEPVILAAAREAGARVIFESEFVSLTQNDAEVRAVVRDRTTGDDRTIVASYLAGADGANSTVAKSVGISLVGEMGLGQAMNVWLEADLTSFCAHRPSVLYWMVRPGNDYWVGSGTWICVKPFTEWVLLFMYDPQQGEPDLSDAALIARAHTTIGDASIPVRIKSASKWQINHVVAARYREGRVFLVGDAAHRHPPANGLGSNTSVQDAFNLAWKIALVLKGIADGSLLDSYDAERRPVGRQVVDRALKSVVDMKPISDALGFCPGQSEEQGWAALDELSAATPRGVQRRQQLAAAVALQNYQFNAQGVELGQRYASTAICPTTIAVKPTRDPELFYEPTTVPGGCLPHAWLQRGTARVSTQDLCAPTQFTLITGIGGEPWIEAVNRLRATKQWPLTAVQIGPGQLVTDATGDWTRLSGVTEQGCVLVRPDLFVAWRAESLPQDAANALTAALSAIMGHAKDVPLSKAVA